MQDKIKADADKKDEISLEELIEQKRAELSARDDLTPVTLESFVLWKKRKLREKLALEKKEASKKKEKFNAGVKMGLSGREMFAFDPNLVSMEVSEQAEIDSKTTTCPAPRNSRSLSHKCVCLCTPSKATFVGGQYPPCLLLIR